MNRFLEIALVLAIIGSTLAFGGVQAVTYSLVEVALFGAFALLIGWQTYRGKIQLPVPLWPALFVLTIILQLVPLPSSLVARLSPARIISANSADLLSGSSHWATLSIYPHATAQALLKLVAYFVAFVLAAYLFDSRQRQSILWWTLVALGIFEAGYGIVQSLTGSNMIFTYTNVYAKGDATGTYINRNHFAGLLELTMPLVIGYTYYKAEGWWETRHSGRGPSDRRAVSGFQPLFYFFVVVLMVVAAVLSKSRMGIISILLSLLFVGLLGQVKGGRKAWMLGLALLVFLAGAYGLWIGLGPVLSRFEAMLGPDYLKMEGRVTMWRDGLRLFQTCPVLGTGLGTFEHGFRQYQTVAVGKLVDHAHNDYLEFGAETGLVGFVLLFLPILFLFGRMIVSFLNDSRRFRRAVTLGCIGSSLGILIHSVSDFNLQIPANALIFATVLGVGYKIACVEKEEKAARDRPAEA